MEFKEIKIDDVLNDRDLLSKVLKSYNAQKKTTTIYYEKNKEQRNEKSKSYYYKKEGKEPKKEKKTADMKQYMKEYRLKQKNKKNAIENNE
jgi:hypothetical protein